MPKVKTADINTYYEIHGKGEPLVLIPGSNANTTSYNAQIPVFAREYRVILYDPRGAGQSDAPPPPYSMAMLADDLANLLDAIDIESAHIWGCSMGGMIAQHFAIRHPRKVRSLILACTTCGGPHAVQTADPELMSFSKRAITLSPKEMLTETLRFMMSKEFFEEHPALIEEMVARGMAHPVSQQGRMGQGHASRGHDAFDNLPRISAPTLVIHGNADRVIPAANAGILASRIPGAEVAVIENVGHLFITEAFDESNRIILDFLRRHTAV
jgi:3-oxoadipate enol-lactonase